MNTHKHPTRVDAKAFGVEPSERPVRTALLKKQEAMLCA